MYIRVLYSCSDEHERDSLVHEVLVYVNKRTKVDLKQNTPSNLNGNELYMLYLLSTRWMKGQNSASA